MTGTDRDTPRLDDLEAERRRLLSLAYRMTGTLSDAEDVVQETYLRWYRLDPAEQDAIENLPGWLTRVAGRVALDQLGSARARRERYIGQWLPEPVPADLFAGTAPTSLTAAPAPDPADRVTLDESVGTALLVVLESMTPAERVAFVLHDVFALPFDEIADVVGRSVGATRQLAASARKHVRDHRVAEVPSADRDRTVRAFLEASRSGDIARLVEVLDPRVVLRSDGGGVVNAARNAVVGSDHVARFVLGVLAKQQSLVFEELTTADGLAYRLRMGENFYGIVTLRVTGGLVTDVWFMLNPAKLTSWLPT